MKYARKNATPEQILQAAAALQAASASVSAALSAVSGSVKVKLLDDYIGLVERLRTESLKLEDDFAELVANRYKVPVVMVPLFGDAENLGRAAAFLSSLASKREP